jgi:hypothetical protein
MGLEAHHDIGFASAPFTDAKQSNVGGADPLILNPGEKVTLKAWQPGFWRFGGGQRLVTLHSPGAARAAGSLL